MELVAARSSDNSIKHNDMPKMFELRYRVFRQRLQWDVATNGRYEQDDYDRDDTVYVIARTPQGDIDGCCRLLPTTGPYMLKDTFPELLQGRPAPSDPSIWEISRFATSSRDKGDGARFSDTPVRLIDKLVEFGAAAHISSFVFVTTVAFERLLRHLGLICPRLAPPMQIGIEKTVALQLNVNAHTIGTLAWRLRPTQSMKSA
ncbi:MAG: GNAT family N-acetyltransferase [Gammaproteobacteria bacterium]|nr:GNAT family N-acetyltransferase [Gammaproteobacteria bacterium]